MKAFYQINELSREINELRAKGKVIGFVPTMGALHDGHLLLVKNAQQECDVVVVSIFVNPTQFNNAKDLELYPRQEEKDLSLLEKNGCDYVILPSKGEIYPEDYKTITLDLGGLEKVMEGKFRPGHFQGVVNVVSRLFAIVNPDNAYFGRKDFQQLAVIKEMVRQLQIPVRIIGVEIKRDLHGLALSSRNARLNEEELEKSLILVETLQKGKQWAKEKSPQETTKLMLEMFQKSELEVEYIEVVHPDTLETLQGDWVPGATACIAAFCGEVRLIDNMELIPN